MSVSVLYVYVYVCVYTVFAGELHFFLFLNVLRNCPASNVAVLWMGDRVL